MSTEPSPLDVPKVEGRSLDYGWEPDGSRQIWNTGDKKYGSLPIKMLRFSTSVARTEVIALAPDEEPERLEQGQVFGSLPQEMI